MNSDVARLLRWLARAVPDYRRELRPGEPVGAPSERAHVELLMLHDSAAEDIRRFQERQINITNLAVPVYAGLLAYAKLINLNQQGWVWFAVLAIATTEVCVLGSLWVLRLQGAMFRARQRVDRIRPRLTATFREVLGESPVTEPVEQTDTIYLLVSVLVGGAVLTTIRLVTLLRPFQT